MKNLKQKIKKFLVSVCVLAVVSSILAFCVVKIALFVENPVKIYETVDVYVPRVNKVLTVEDKIRKVAREKGFKFADYLVKLAKCESRLDPLAIGDSGKSRGLFQIHSGYHPEVSTLQAFNIEFATAWTIDMIEKGEQHQWSCNKIVLAKF